tara:strand:+ start:3880 stop:4839 length:960 start_codon:yes stop_codon:yes gene_type:complete
MLDLFSGIGGFALAAQWVWKDELEIVGFCEIEEYAQKVLKKNFPNVSIYEDITKLNGKEIKNIDLLTGGFPCQDISIAGKGAGIEGERSGLWSEMYRIISEIRPKYALIENVPMLIHRGLERVLCDLAKIGYDAEWQVIGADDVGAWHKRKRIWIVAYPKKPRARQDDRRIRSRFSGANRGEKTITEEKTYSNSSSLRWNSRFNNWEKRLIQKIKKRIDKKDKSKWRRWEHRFRKVCKTNANTYSFRRKYSLERQEEIRQLNSGDQQTERRKGQYWTVEPKVGRVANGVPHRVDRLKGLGNAIVPQVAEIIMNRIKNAI